MHVRSEVFSLCVEAVGSDLSLFVAGVHWLVALVAWHLHRVVLNDILLDDGVTSSKR